MIFCVHCHVTAKGIEVFLEVIKTPSVFSVKRRNSKIIRSAYDLTPKNNQYHPRMSRKVRIASDHLQLKTLKKHPSGILN